VTLIVSGPGGTAQAVKPGYITVNPPPSVPTATFSADVISGTAPLTVAFTAVTSGTVEGWRWDFGDGDVALTGPIEQHTYQIPGVFDVSLTVSNTYGSYTVSVPDYITVTEPPIPAPEVDFTGTPRSGDAPLDVQFTSEVTGEVTSYAWAFGDGGIASTASPTHTYTNAGNFSVSLVVTGPGGTAQAVKPAYITVNAPAGAPTATFSADVVSGTSPFVVTFTAVTSGTVEGWLWDFGDSTVAFTGPVVQHTYQAPGVFDVSLIVSNTYGSYAVNKPGYITVSSSGHRVYLPLVLRK
jgi:PKD repeat protein